MLQSKFRFRSATFFKIDKFRPVCEKHKDRTLIVGLQAKRHSELPPGRQEVKSSQLQGEQGGATELLAHKLVMIVNCHLTGGPTPDRRLRQVVDALGTARKEAARIALDPEDSAGLEQSPRRERLQVASDAREAQGCAVPLVICGDFNGQEPTAVGHLLTTGVVQASFREPGYPEVTTVMVCSRSRSGIAASRSFCNRVVVRAYFNELCRQQLQVDDGQYLHTAVRYDTYSLRPHPWATRTQFAFSAACCFHIHFGPPITFHYSVRVNWRKKKVT